jgi:flagellar biosynthesis GTPase FlhF
LILLLGNRKIKNSTISKLISDANATIYDTRRKLNAEKTLALIADFEENAKALTSNGKFSDATKKYVEALNFIENCGIDSPELNIIKKRILDNKQLTEEKEHQRQLTKLQEQKETLEKERQRIAREREKAIEESTRNLVKSRDEMEEIDWYEDQSTHEKIYTPRSKHIYAYIGKKNDKVWLRFKMVYAAEEWLFVKSVSFKVDGENFKLTYGFLDDWERNNSSYSIWEWKDVLVDENIWNLINKIAKSEKAMMRYEGQQYYSDRDISTTEKVALRNILSAYQSMGGKPPTK